MGYHRARKVRLTRLARPKTHMSDTNKIPSRALVADIGGTNARFALTVEADNARLVARSAEIDRLRAAGKRTVPSTMGEERATNPFLRADQPSVARAVGLPPTDPVAVFAEVRARKDKF